VSAGDPAAAGGFCAHDMVASLTQAGRTRTYTLDPTGNRIWTITDTAGPTAVVASGHDSYAPTSPSTTPPTWRSPSWPKPH
jgi:hypothetical protein